MSAADALRDLADEYATGARHAPAPGEGPRRAGGAPVVPVAVHDVLCGWRVASQQDEPDDDVLRCAGCGMAYPVAEVAAVRALDTENPHWSPPGRSFRASR